MKEQSVRRRISPNENLWLESGRASESRTLLIGDIHEPFCREGYLEHCVSVYKRFNCNKVVFMGDILDSHYSSFHPSDPDGYGAFEELERAQDKISRWYEAFPEATILIGNHDAIPARKAFAGGLSNQWVRSFNEVLGVGSGWVFVNDIVIDGVYYCHGTGTSGMNAARKRALENNMSTVIGHVHTESNISWHADRNKRFFAFIVGCGMDEDSYAAAYAKTFPRRMILACGVILDDGQLPISVPMDVQKRK